MSFNAFIFILGVIVGLIVTTAFGLWNLAKENAHAAFVHAGGAGLMFLGLTVGTFLTCLIFAAIAGKFTN